ncbi:hypothetical protein [Actinokineospora iranica]|uniref:DUF4177 domain-containing protein n=1 Tax=Actinokineospora iranica TaxID=1271860 RepID=A0A1G6Y7F2_9PSEU|nr:hypothetical protein [Actinokineospora iranica]SDD86424.1 hypothetical protein SAMN05216174_12074 [Actinokineospora iranica]
MGIFKDAKANTASADAQKAAQAGQTVFVARFNYPATHHGLSGQIADWSVQIQAVESAGWRVEHFSVAADTKGRPEAYVMFRRH